MKAVVEPKKYIDQLWGKQQIKKGGVYRLLYYVLRMDYRGEVLLHNVVTGGLVVLDQEEAKLIDRLPLAYCPEMKSLVNEHYLVSEDYDEHQQVVHLREILRMLDKAQNPKNAITHYTILPTTACNARCYYCFEQGCESYTMTEHTAEEVIEYIASKCGIEKRVRINWFGGEPTIAVSRIDQICEGLRAKGIDYQGEMTTNGYLFDEDMIQRAVSLWHLTFVMISVDGTEENYNKTKAFVGVKDNPYQRVMRNIGLLLEKKIHVNLRMNFDLDNYLDFKDLAFEIVERYHQSPYLRVTVHPINGAYQNHQGTVSHGCDSWFEGKLVELNKIARSVSPYYQSNELLSLRHRGCQATKDESVVITPQGFLVRCPEQFNKDQFVGDIRGGKSNDNLVRKWQQFADYEKCIDCVLYPYCIRISCCLAQDSCYFKQEDILQCQKAMINALEMIN